MITPPCPYCGEPMRANLAYICGAPRHSQALVTGYSCDKPTCEEQRIKARKRYEDEVIARAIERGVINP